MKEKRTNEINEGPYKPTKLSVAVADQPAKSIPKEKGDYTAEDISSIAKDARVKHLLHSAIDNVMSNRVINCKTAKEIWDALETRCQGTDAIKKNRRTILTQEFVKLLNDLSLVDKEYDLENSNLKFFLALTENWDLKSTTIRDNYDLTKTTLDEIYGMLKIYELEMDQRSKRHERKSRTVALKAEEESSKVAASKRCKGKALIIKSDLESLYSDNDDSETKSLPEMDADAEIMQLCTLMVKGITKIAYRKFRKGKKFSRKGGSSDKKGFKKSKYKGGKSDRGDNSNVKCYNCGERGHISPDCKKGKVTKARHLSQRRKAGHTLQILKIRDEVLKLNESLKADLEKEKEIIRTWTNSGRTTQDILSSENWKEGLGYGDDKKKTVKSDSEKMKESRTEVKEKSTSDKLKHDKPVAVNIGLLTKKQLKHKLKEIRNVNKVKEARKIEIEKKGNRKNILVLDSVCSGHMTGNKALLSDFVEKAGPGVSYGDGNMGKTLGYGNINLGNVIIETVALVSGLKHNLLSKVVPKGYRHGNIYEARLSTNSDGSTICLLSRASIEESWNWHKRLSHLNFNNINELVKKDLVRGLPTSVFAPNGLCDSCQKAKQRKYSFKRKTKSSILDLFGPFNVMYIAKKKYAMVIVDEFTRYTWVYFLHKKNETASTLTDHVRDLDKLVKDSVKVIRSDNGTDFKNSIMEESCKEHGINSDGLSSDVIETVVTTPRENAPAQGDSDEPNSDNSGNSDSSTPEGSNSNSEVLESITIGGASENADGDIMDHGGASSSRNQLPSARKWTKSYTPGLIIGDPEAGVRTRTTISNECFYHSFLSQTEPKKVEEAIQDADWVQAMLEELNEFERNKVWTLVPRPKNISIVGTKWVFRNKTDSDGIITRNKARLVAKGYSQ
ncbi:hypothetical protein AgCh_010107 [Apium graveolens]